MCVCVCVCVCGCVRWKAKPAYINWKHILALGTFLNIEINSKEYSL